MFIVTALRHVLVMDVLFYQAPSDPGSHPIAHPELLSTVPGTQVRKTNILNDMQNPGNVKT